MTVIVVAPHADDEVLGVGGTIAKRAAAGEDVHVVIATKGRPPRFTNDLMQTIRGEAAAAHAMLGVKKTHYLDFPAAELDQISHSDVNVALGAVFAEVKPSAVYLPFAGDLHLDHQRVALSAMVCSRPIGPNPPVEVYAYEVLSETNWNAPYVAPGFTPSVFVDIADHLELKLRALSAFKSQIRDFPDERSLRAARALAELRGAQVSRHAAEAFVSIRQIV